MSKAAFQKANSTPKKYINALRAFELSTLVTETILVMLQVGAAGK